MKIENMSRRDFLKTGAITGGGLVLGFALPTINKALARQVGEADATYPVAAWLQVDQAGLVKLVIPCSEMGQGSQASLAMILCDEAGADYYTLQALNPPNNAYSITRCSACRRPAAVPRCAPGGSRYAWSALPCARCWWPRQQSSGRSNRANAPRRTITRYTNRPAGSCTSGSWSALPST